MQLAHFLPLSWTGKWSTVCQSQKNERKKRKRFQEEVRLRVDAIAMYQSISVTFLDDNFSILDFFSLCNMVFIMLTNFSRENLFRDIIQR